MSIDPIVQANSVNTPREEILTSLRKEVEAGLAGLIALSEPRSLYEPVRYALSSPGKRLRPVLLLLTARTFGATVEAALPAALAMEVFHTFTLVHDDIMDRSDTRRGVPTVYKKWDDSTAILAGDLLLALSYDLLSRVNSAEIGGILRVYTAMVHRLCEGQALDKEFETRVDVTVDDYFQMIDRKTAALIEACFQIGAMCGSQDDAVVDACRRIGRHIGRAFQVQDDLLDLLAEDERWGKKIGGDLVNGKKTFLLLSALEAARGETHTWFMRILENGGLPEADIGEARKKMEKLGIIDKARSCVVDHTRAAITILDSFPPKPEVEVIRHLVNSLQNRVH